MKPIIGVVPRYKKLEQNIPIVYISEHVRRTLQKAGADVNLIMPVQDINNIDYKTKDFKPYTKDEKLQIEKILNNCDALLIPGGSKATPYDRYLLEKAIERKMPVLGICLGMQVMSFYKEEIQLDDIDTNTSINHYSTDDDKLVHKVNIKKSSKLYNIINEDTIDVNSYHKKRTTKNHVYKISAISEDGVIEAIEYPDKVFNIGLQWHPEISYNFDYNSKIIINKFIEEAKLYRKNKNKDRLIVG